MKFISRKKVPKPPLVEQEIQKPIQTDPPSEVERFLLNPVRGEIKPTGLWRLGSLSGVSAPLDHQHPTALIDIGTDQPPFPNEIRYQVDNGALRLFINQGGWFTFAQGILLNLTHPLPPINNELRLQNSSLLYWTGTIWRVVEAVPIPRPLSDTTPPTNNELRLDNGILVYRSSTWLPIGAKPILRFINNTETPLANELRFDNTNQYLILRQGNSWLPIGGIALIRERTVSQPYPNELAYQGSFLYRWNGSQWLLITTISTIKEQSDTTSPINNELRYIGNTRVLILHLNNNWVRLGAIPVMRSRPSITDPIINELAYENNQLYLWDGSQWVSVGGGGGGGSTAVVKPLTHPDTPLENELRYENHTTFGLRLVLSDGANWMPLHRKALAIPDVVSGGTIGETGCLVYRTNDQTLYYNQGGTRRYIYASLPSTTEVPDNTGFGNRILALDTASLRLVVRGTQTQQPVYALSVVPDTQPNEGSVLTGRLWFNTSDGVLYRHNGTNFVRFFSSSDRIRYFSTRAVSGTGSGVGDIRLTSDEIFYAIEVGSTRPFLPVHQGVFLPPERWVLFTNEGTTTTQPMGFGQISRFLTTNRYLYFPAGLTNYESLVGTTLGMFVALQRGTFKLFFEMYGQKQGSNDNPVWSLFIGFHKVSDGDIYETAEIQLPNPQTLYNISLSQTGNEVIRYTLTTNINLEGTFTLRPYGLPSTQTTGIAPNERYVISLTLRRNRSAETGVRPDFYFLGAYCQIFAPLNALHLTV